MAEGNRRTKERRRARIIGWPAAAAILIGVTAGVYLGGFEFVAKAAVPAAVAVTFALARRFLPARELPYEGKDYNSADLDLRFDGTQWLVGLGTTVVGVAFFLLTHLGLVAANRGLAEAEGPAHFMIPPQAAIWWFFPLFGALALSWEITLLIWSACGDRNEVRLYDAWSSRKAGFDSRRVLRLLALFVALPIGILTCLALPMHDTLHDAGIRSTGFAWRNRSVYRYSEARRLTTIEGFRTDGKLTRRAGVVIDFADGRRWSSADRSDYNDPLDPQLVMFLQQKTGLPLEHAVTADEIHAQGQ
jgi:hypothetical protein